MNDTDPSKSSNEVNPGAGQWEDLGNPHSEDDTQAPVDEAEKAFNDYSARTGKTLEDYTGIAEQDPQDTDE